MDRKRPKKLPDVQTEVRRLLDAQLYYEVDHAQLRMIQRGIFSRQVRHVLRYGCRDLSRDTFDERTGTWRYVIQGIDPDKDRRIRVAFSIVEVPPLPGTWVVVVTVIDLD